MEQSVSSQLEYEPAKPFLRRRRIRRAIVALTLLVGAVALWRAGPPFLRQVRYVYWQSRCMSFTAPRDFVAYEEEPTRAAALLLNRPGYQRVSYTLGRPNGAPAVGFVPPPLSRMGAGWVNMVFLHQRTTPTTGRKRLIVLGFRTESNSNLGRRRGGRVIQFYGSGKLTATLVPGSEIEGVAHRKLCLVLNDDDMLRLFWGQPDPERADHFTVGYLLNDQPGAIDGWLKDDGQLDLRVRDGPATRIAATLPY